MLNEFCQNFQKEQVVQLAQQEDTAILTIARSF